jgi:hypothetical protein
MRTCGARNGGSWHFGFNMAGDIAEALVQGRERVLVDHFLTRDTVGVHDPASIDTAAIDHYAAALARPGRCP